METIADNMLYIISDSNNHDFLKDEDATVINCTRLPFDESPENVNPVVSLWACSTHMEDYSTAATTEEGGQK
jgi:hypothetical protein